MSDFREGFEKWLNSKFICTDGGTNEWTKQFEYAYPHVQSMWVAWQASRQHDGHAEFVRAAYAIGLKLEGATDIGSTAEALRKKALDRYYKLAELAKEKGNG